jgi:hypothetical protein
MEDARVPFAFTKGKQNYALTSFVLGILSLGPTILAFEALTDRYSLLFVGYSLLFGGIFGAFGVYYAGAAVFAIKTAKSKILDLFLALLGASMSVPCLVLYPGMLMRFFDPE